MMNPQHNKEKLVQDVKTYLKSFQMHAYETWILGCVEYFIEEGYTLDQIKESAYQQWVLNDLKHICPGSLPDNLAKLEKTVLNGQFILQINSALDISTPAYQQYLKMKKTDTENIKATKNSEENISSKRMLKFELTDGKQIIAGMEYETITKLKTEDIVPGCKIMIIGPVQCRQGMLLLTDSAVKFLNGEVENMLKTHSLAAQLASKLNLPLIENDPTEIEVIPHDFNGVSNDGPSPTAHESHFQRNVINRPTPCSIPTASNSSSVKSSNNVSKETSRVTSTGSNKRSLEAESVPEKKLKLEEAAFAQCENDVDDLGLEEADFLAIEECERLHTSKTPVMVSSEPFVYIKQLNELCESEKSGKIFRVKAQIQNVMTKLTMTANREWNLKCTIIDGTGYMDVEFASHILSEFLGYTPENISELKKKVATNPEIKTEIQSAYAKTAETLRTLYCIMELTMNTLPKITRLIEFDDFHSELVKERVNNEDVKIKLSLR